MFGIRDELNSADITILSAILSPKYKFPPIVKSSVTSILPETTTLPSFSPIFNKVIFEEPSPTCSVSLSVLKNGSAN